MDDRARDESADARDGRFSETTSPPVPAADADGSARGPGQPPMAAAVDVDGIAVVCLGTALWAVALVFSLVYEDRLRRDGHLWWIATAACGLGLGLLGIAYCVRRRNRLGDPQARPPE